MFPKSFPCRCDDRGPARLVDHFDPEFGGLLHLRSRARPCDEEIGLGAHRSAGLRAQPLGLRLGLVAAHGFELAGEDHRLARDGAALRFHLEARRRDLRQDIVPHRAVVILVEEIAQGLDHGAADPVDSSEFGDSLFLSLPGALCHLAQGG